VAAFDPFEIKDPMPKDEDSFLPEEPQAPAPSRPRRKVLWGGLLLANVALILACGLGLLGRVRHLASQGRQPPTAQAPAHPLPPAPAPRPAAKEEPKPQPPSPAKPAAPSQEPAKPEAAKASAAPAAPAAKPVQAVPVLFKHSDPSAKEAYLVGAFLVRANGRKAMFKDSAGEWRLEIYLNPGATYPYRIETVNAQGKRQVSKKQKLFVPLRP
jgi:cell division septation protein DedD